MLADIKLLLGITDTSKDALLNQLIAQCTEYIKSHCHIDNINHMIGVLNQMVVYTYNRLKTEGLESENFNAASYKYELDFPAFIIRELNQNRKIRVI